MELPLSHRNRPGRRGRRSAQRQHTRRQVPPHTTQAAQRAQRTRTSRAEAHIGTPRTLNYCPLPVLPVLGAVLVCDPCKSPVSDPPPPTHILCLCCRPIPPSPTPSPISLRHISPFSSSSHPPPSPPPPADDSSPLRPAVQLTTDDSASLDIRFSPSITF